ncbi:MAG TPA: hypothetical protein VFQ78_14355 [Candidatus Udaeobacter sp.]|jgi:hypothetical protein|nr:hypothetical protein [Candidatus Udaeobacter sp.]HEU0273221.1 hypothetical protein [Candidatus Udaeobacter sp.]
MKALALEPKVISLANTLGIEDNDPVAGIRDYCLERVRRSIHGLAKITDVRQLEKVVCQKLNLTVHEIWSDAELTDMASHYVAAREPVFAFLDQDLNDSTYGVLIRLNKRIGSRFCWVAVVDCRGDKRYRRFFTLWHEVVHCITAAEQYELPFHRTKISGSLADPLERLTDLVASDLAFFDPLFRPLLDEELSVNGRVTFSGVEKVRERFCPDASFESTLNACVSRCDIPTIFIKAGLGYKIVEIAAMESPQTQLFPTAPPVARLRVLTAVTNDAARSISLRIHQNMRVPAGSVISSVFFDASMAGAAGVENLRDWTSSDGDALAAVEVALDARKMGDQIFALVTPASACRNERSPKPR